MNAEEVYKEQRSHWMNMSWSWMAWDDHNSTSLTFNRELEIKPNSEGIIKLQLAVKQFQPFQE